MTFGPTGIKQSLFDTFEDVNADYNLALASMVAGSAKVKTTTICYCTHTRVRTDRQIDTDTDTDTDTITDRHRHCRMHVPPPPLTHTNLISIPCALVMMSHSFCALVLMSHCQHSFCASVFTREGHGPSYTQCVEREREMCARTIGGCIPRLCQFGYCVFCLPSFVRFSLLPGVLRPVSLNCLARQTLPCDVHRPLLLRRLLKTTQSRWCARSRQVTQPP